MRPIAILLLICSLFLLACDQNIEERNHLQQINVWLDASPELLAVLHEQMQSAENAGAKMKVNFRSIRFEDLKPAIMGCRQNNSLEKPDLIMFSSDWLGELVEAGLVASLPIDANAYLPLAASAMKWQGGCYGRPWSLDTVALLVNRKLVPQPPENFEQMLEVSRNLPEGIFPLIYDNKNFYYHAAWFHAFAGPVFNDGRPVLNSELACRSFDFVYDLEARHGLVPAKANQAAAINLFAAGQAAMTINGPWAVPDFIRNRVDFTVVPVPSPGEGLQARPFVGIKGLAVTSFAKNATLAQKVLRHLTSEETMQKVAERSSLVPCFKSVAGNRQTWMKGFVDQAERGFLMPADPEMKFVWSEMNRALRLRFIASATSSDLLNEAQMRIEKQIEREVGGKK